MKKIYIMPCQRVVELDMEQVCATSGLLEDNVTTVNVSMHMDNEEEYEGVFGARTNSVWDEEW